MRIAHVFLCVSVCVNLGLLCAASTATSAAGTTNSPSTSAMMTSTAATSTMGDTGATSTMQGTMTSGTMAAPTSTMQGTSGTMAAATGTSTMQGTMTSGTMAAGTSTMQGTMATSTMAATSSMAAPTTSAAMTSTAAATTTRMPTTTAATTTTPAPTTPAPAPFSSFTTAESTNVRSAANTITLTFTPSVVVMSPETITISGLSGTGTADNAALPLTGKSATKFGSAGSWTQSSGMLVLTLGSGQQLLQSETTVVTVTLTNPSVQQAAPTVTISGSGSQALTSATATGPILTGAGNPPSNFVSATVSESTSVQGVMNTLTFSFLPAVTVPVGTSITINGLTGTQTTATSLALTGSGSLSFSNQLGSWNQVTGTLTLTVSQPLSSSTPTTISIVVLNPSQSQTAVTPTIVATGSQALAMFTFSSSVLSASSVNPCLVNNGQCSQTCTLSAVGTAICSCANGYIGDGLITGTGCTTTFSFTLAATPSTFNVTAFRCNMASIISSNLPAGGQPLTCDDIVLTQDPIFS